MAHFEERTYNFSTPDEYTAAMNAAWGAGCFVRTEGEKLAFTIRGSAAELDKYNTAVAPPADQTVEESKGVTGAELADTGAPNPPAG